MGFSLVPLLSPSRAIIIMMDDGVCVHKVSREGSVHLDTVPWRTSGFEDRLVDIINQSGVSSVLILNDAVEQHYRKEKISVPTAFDKANIIKRRLNVAFPSYPMRAAVELKEATALAKARSKEAEGDKGAEKEKAGGIYLFAAAPSTETFSRIVRAVSKTDCNLSGYGLLPLESADMLKELSKKLSEKRIGMAASVWTILVGQHRGGGLRQIVVRGNELALTRITPLDEPKPGEADAWAADVSTEIQATLSYLSRFGYVPEDGLNIIVLGDKSFAEVLDGMINVPSNFEALYPYEAANMIGVKLSQVEGAHFSDGLHAGWVGKKLSLALPLSCKEIADIAGPRKMASLAMILMILALGGILYEVSDEAQGYYQDSANLEVAKASLGEIEQIYQDEIKRKESMGIDINLINAALDIDHRLKQRRVDVLGILQDVGREMGTLRIDSFEFTADGDALSSSTSQPSQSPDRPVKLKLAFSFAGNINPKDGNKEIYDLADRLNARLRPMGYDASVSQPLQNLTFRGEVNKEVGLTANQRSLTERYSSEILIQKVNNAQSSGK